ncbi:RWD-domain-containing protein [Rhizodiscina lignyota]|uniref:RBR-type E3 ubiquitin transferase n=1 Tax=Rhizodiscina lignyota TaxID=1504668 RepID=A0A9P4IA85_9PEZI|nr:RWD-domain-containing protein [Rhizodiscina lignyota]
MADLNGDDEREEELSSITAIYPELVVDPSNPFSASIDIPVAPSTPLAVLFPPAIDTLTQIPLDTHRLEHLPPLQLHIILPNGYPSECPPHLEIKTTPSWLPAETLERLIKEGHNLWEEYGRGQVVFAYIDFLQNEAEASFELITPQNEELEIPQEMKIELLDFDIKMKRKKFEAETFDCGVCLEPKKGSVCYRLMKCGHVFCVPCLQDFYNNCISEGDVASVRCIDPDCGKENGRRRKKSGTLNPSELLQIPLDKEVVKRYVELKRKKKLESDKSTIYCPRKWCQGPARSKKYPKVTDPFSMEAFESDSEDESAPVPPNTNDTKPNPANIERLAICEDCNFAFCRVCLASWHGDYVRCWPRSEAEISADEKASFDYIRLHTSPCPTCSSPCQKTHGCNHMNCFQCHTHFCYLCSSWLDPSNPYQHFNKKEIGCYMRLWELEEGDEGVGNGRFNGARGWEAAIAAAEEADANAPQENEEVGALQQAMNNAGIQDRPPAPAAVQRAHRRPVGPPDANAPGIRRFVELAMNDEEDDWDSDELGSDDEDWEIPMMPQVPRRI